MDKERIRLLLDYLSRHERHLADSYDRIEEKTSQAILDTWIQFTSESDRLGSIEEQTIGLDMSCDEVVAVALDLDDKIVELYRDMAREAESPHVREFFENLLELERSEELQVTRNALFLRDY